MKELEVYLATKLGYYREVEVTEDSQSGECYGTSGPLGLKVYPGKRRIPGRVVHFFDIKPTEIKVENKNPDYRDINKRKKTMADLLMQLLRDANQFREERGCDIAVITTPTTHSSCHEVTGLSCMVQGCYVSAGDNE